MLTALRRAALAATAALAAAACSSVDCPLDYTVAARYGLYSGYMQPDTLRDTLTITTTYAGGNDRVLLNRLSRATGFTLPMSYQREADTLYIDLEGPEGSSRDTLRVSKTDYTHFESVDCQLSFFHDITSVEHTCHAIDSVVVADKTVNNDKQRENIRLYLKARR